MSKIKIKNFGPIKEGYLENDGWMDIKKVTVFIGNQGSGKSTVAKLISTMSWIEKAMNRGDLQTKKFHTALLLNLLKYQRINNYFDHNRTIIEYEGDSFYIGYKYNNQFPVIKKLNTKPYVAPKIMYVPSERNFLSSVSEAFNVKGLPATLFTFAEELRQAQKNLNGDSIILPISEYKYKYDEENDSSTIIGEGYQISILEASSGLQSMIPLFLVSRYLSNIVNDESINTNTISVNSLIRMNNEISQIMMNDLLTSEEKEREYKGIREKYINKCLLNIVEEPEQNLYPSSQRKIFNTLLEYNNLNKHDKLVVTTHSPYLINYLTHSIKAHTVLAKINSSKNKIELKKILNKIVPLNSIVSPEDWIVFEMNEKDGSIIKLKEYKGLPSDENYLNEKMAETNEIFAKLLEIEDKCQIS